MQVACHVLWPRAAWLYHGAIFLMTLRFLVSGGQVSKPTLGRQKLVLYGMIFVRVSYQAGINSVIKRKFSSNSHNIFMTMHKVTEDAITIASC